MATKARETPALQEIDMHFPLAGIDLSQSLERQPARQVDQELWARTTPIALNVRGYEAATNRQRGGYRPGLAKYIEAAVVEGWIIQELAILVTTG